MKADAYDDLAARWDEAHAGKPAPAFDRGDAIKRARELLSPAAGEREAPAYPVAALGPLAEACAAVAEHGQVQPAMAGQCLLGAASLLTQGMHNVETLAGDRPLSLYLLTLGDSGEGKSTAQGAALQPVFDWQRDASEIFRAELAEFEQARSRRKKGDAAPEVPASPYRLIRDATVEGLRRDLDGGPCAQGIFSDEAAAIMAGYGMSPEHRAKTAGTFSGLWDNGHLSVSRATGGRVERYGRRVALHRLIQPLAASESLADPMLSALGFWPRFLAAWPSPQAPRLARPFRPHLLPAVGRYWQRCAELLRQPLPDDVTDQPTLPLSDDAQALLRAAFERFEVQARRGDLRSVKPYALRAAEQACRTAGVLCAFGGRRDVVDAEAMRGALALVAYSLDTWQAIADEGVADTGTQHALKLHEWLTGRPEWRAGLRDILNEGPRPRTKDARDAALGLLREFELAEVSDGEARALIPGSLQ